MKFVVDAKFYCRILVLEKNTHFAAYLFDCILLVFTIATQPWTNTLLRLCLSLLQLKFRLGDVQVPDIPGMFTTFKARDVPLFVDGQQFQLPQHFGKIMGDDTPVNLRWRDGVTESHYTATRRRKEQ